MLTHSELSTANRETVRLVSKRAFAGAAGPAGSGGSGQAAVRGPATCPRSGGDRCLTRPPRRQMTLRSGDFLSAVHQALDLPAPERARDQLVFLSLLEQRARLACQASADSSATRTATPWTTPLRQITSCTSFRLAAGQLPAPPARIVTAASHPVTGHLTGRVRAVPLAIGSAAGRCSRPALALRRGPATLRDAASPRGAHRCQMAPGLAAE